MLEKPYRAQDPIGKQEKDSPKGYKLIVSSDKILHPTDSIKLSNSLILHINTN